MNRKDFETLMNSLFSNNQLFIPQEQTIEEWIDNAFVNEEKEAINYTHCCTEVCECKKHSIKTSYGFEICTKCGNEWDV